MHKAFINVNPSTRAASRPLAWMLLHVVVISLFSGMTHAADAPAVHQQLESGKNVRVIDLGANGMNELSEAVKRLNAPPPTATQPTAPADNESPEAAASETDNIENLAAGNSASVDATPSGNEHPAWLIGKWGSEPGCAQKSTAGGARLLEIADRRLTLSAQTCEIKAISHSQADETLVIYDCRQSKSTTQEAHVFKKIDATRLLLDNIGNFTRCGTP